MPVELRLERLSDEMEYGTIVRWLVAEGAQDGEVRVVEPITVIHRGWQLDGRGNGGTTHPADA